MTLRLLLPPSVGSARARARGELLDQSLRADLAETVEIDVADGYADLGDRAERGDADLVWMPPTVCARLEPNLRGVFKCVRQGKTSYRSAIVVRKDTLTSLAQLAGKRAAWVDRLSVGGYLLALSELRDRGLVDGLRDQRFHGSYPNALDALLEGQADFAAVTVRDGTPSALRDALAAFGGKTAAEELVGIHVTRETPNDAIGLTRALDPKRAERIARRVFEQKGARARAAFCLALDAEGFVRAIAGEYAELRRLIAHE
ncbi:MAG: PhnD/SsuA/transferrin family substrate-binding protein [Sandaracinaceae bacterium]|nr:PhnD/SsuA/transferrin family substrate-binding protein [Sandaracinaceae bacterium]